MNEATKALLDDAKREVVELQKKRRTRWAATLMERLIAALDTPAPAPAEDKAEDALDEWLDRKE